MNIRKGIVMYMTIYGHIKYTKNTHIYKHEKCISPHLSLRQSILPSCSLPLFALQYIHYSFLFPVSPFRLYS